MWLYCPLAMTQPPRSSDSGRGERGLHVFGVLLEGGGRASAVAVDAIEKKGSAHSDQARQHEPSLSRRREL